LRRLDLFAAINAVPAEDGPDRATSAIDSARTIAGSSWRNPLTAAHGEVHVGADGCEYDRVMTIANRKAGDAVDGRGRLK
jgi:hypothetical protein